VNGHPWMTRVWTVGVRGLAGLASKPNQARELMRVLAISHGAAEAIKQIVTSSQLTEGGVRLSVESIDDQGARLDLSLADSPEPGDSLVEEEGANVFVEQNAAMFLDDKVLDATMEGDRVSFSITERHQDWSHDGQPENFDLRRII
jgi:iron-sulfur cluster assembly protein